MAAAPTGAAAFTDVPVIDFGALREPAGSAGRAALCEELRHVAHTVGFFYAARTGVREETCAAALAEAKAFFAADTAAKEGMDNRGSPAFRGYIRLGAENTRGLPDVREQVEMGLEQDPAPRGAMPPYRRLLGPNQWPAPPHAPGFRPAMEAFMGEMTGFSAELMRALSEGMGMGPDAFEPTVLGSPHVQMKVARYPPSGEGAFGVGAHTDSGYLSLLLQDGVGGLQAQNGAGEWVDVAPKPGTFVVNTGEMLQLATGGYLLATPHRVVNRGGEGAEARLSVPYFYNPNLEAVVEPLELPGELVWERERAAERGEDGRNAVVGQYGANALKSLARSHPEVMARHHPDLKVMPDGAVVALEQAGA